MTGKGSSVAIQGGSFVLIGGASLVGSSTAELMLERGARQVTILDNFAYGADANIAHLVSDPRLAVRKGDVTRMEDVTGAVAGADGVVHLAALMTISMSGNPRRGIDVNIGGAANVVDACCAQGVRKLIFASSNAVYGYGPQVSGRLVEATPFHADGASPASALYGASKIIGEQLCRDAFQRHGLGYLVLRYSTVYGERQHARAANSAFILDAIEKIGRGEAPVCAGTGAETKHYVYVGDVARANLAALESERVDGAFNVSGPRPTTSREVLELLLEILGSRLRPVYTAPTDSQRLLAVGGPFEIDHARATEALGWAPEVDMREGLSRLVAWRG
ncbi:MAG TPA: NAD-dependent epimerase/dehydratase family protein [Dongiaceae bacterium]|jgi:UDP-glucose 4-epimerase|nr:NAD-dependent epimerase/dehydratase family protein [Dongiaceae bacterium]